MIKYPKTNCKYRIESGVRTYDTFREGKLKILMKTRFTIIYHGNSYLLSQV